MRKRLRLNRLKREIAIQKKIRGATGRRKKNLINKLEIGNGLVIEDERSIEKKSSKYFKNLYSTQEE